MKLTINKKGAAFSQVIAGGIACITLVVTAVIIGSVENGTSWSQTLSGTIGDYVEPLAMLSAFAVIGATVYKAVKR